MMGECAWLYYASCQPNVRGNPTSQLRSELMMAKKENRLLTCRSVLFEQLLSCREDYLNLIRSPNKGVRSF